MFKKKQPPKQFQVHYVCDGCGAETTIIHSDSDPKGRDISHDPLTHWIQPNPEEKGKLIFKKGGYLYFSREESLSIVCGNWIRFDHKTIDTQKL